MKTKVSVLSPVSPRLQWQIYKIRPLLLAIFRLVENKSARASCEGCLVLPTCLARFRSKFPSQLLLEAVRGRVHHVLVPVLPGLAVQVSADFPRPGMLLLMHNIVFFSAIIQLGIGLLLMLESICSEHPYLHSKLFPIDDNYMTTVGCTSFRKLPGPEGHDHIITDVLTTPRTQLFCWSHALCIWLAEYPESTAF